MAFEAAGIDAVWQRRGDDEQAVCESSGKLLVRVAPHLRRPAEVEALVGDFSKAEATLGWRPQVMLNELCSMMVNADLNRQKKLRGMHLGLPAPESRLPMDFLLAGQPEAGTNSWQQRGVLNINP
jgi:hypothetical protein